MRRRMNVLKKVIVAGVSALALFGMTGCGASVGDDGSNSAIEAYTVSFPDNSAVYCLQSVSENSGIKCLWNQAVTNPEPSGLIGSIQNVGGVKVRCVADGSGTIDCEDTAK